MENGNIRPYKILINTDRTPIVGEWVSASYSSLNRDVDDWVRFIFVDGERVPAFTKASGNPKRDNATWHIIDPDAEPRWIAHSDCMKITAIKLIDDLSDNPNQHRPEYETSHWDASKSVWLLHLESLPSNLEFEMAKDRHAKPTTSNSIRDLFRWRPAA